MIVYGKRERRINCAGVIADVEAALSEDPGPTPIVDHARLVGAFLKAAALAQGLADAEYHSLGGVDEDVLFVTYEMVEHAWNLERNRSQNEIDGAAS